MKMNEYLITHKDCKRPDMETIETRITAANRWNAIFCIQYGSNEPQEIISCKFIPPASELLTTREQDYARFAAEYYIP